MSLKKHPYTSAFDLAARKSAANDKPYQTFPELPSLVDLSPRDIAKLAAQLNERHLGVLLKGLAQQQRLAKKDGLTGINNLLALKDYIAKLEKEINIPENLRDNRYTDNGAKVSSYAVIMFDLDRFKSVNDGLGHGTGDIVLKAFSQIMEGLIRKGDIVARIGGEEFVVVIPITKPGEAEAIIESFCKRVDDELSKTWIPIGNGRKICVSTSHGYAIYKKDGDNFEALKEKADEKLYEHKNSAGKANRGYRLAPQDPLATPSAAPSAP